jgi:hypothetical protein
VEQAVQLCEKALVLVDRPYQDLLATARYVLARVALARGQAARTQSLLRDFIMENYFSWPPVQLGFQLAGMLAVQRMAGQPAVARRAATLFGAQAAVEDSLRQVIPAGEWQAYQQSLAELRAALSPADFAAAWAAGQALTLEEASAYALAVEE